MRWKSRDIKASGLVRRYREGLVGVQYVTETSDNNNKKMSDYGEDDEQDNNIDSALLSRADLLDVEYPNRPRNTSPTLKFRDLVCSLFEALVDLQHKPRTRKGGQYSAHEARRNAINRFIQRWRNEVGPDIYPAFRLIMPERDKDRPMYGLKEASLGKMLVAVRSRLAIS
jgi:hypothetical protein